MPFKIGGYIPCLHTGAGGGQVQGCSEMNGATDAKDLCSAQHLVRL